MKQVVIIGSGAGGAAAARALQGPFQVTVLEEGGEFKPFSFDLSLLEKLKKTGLFLDEREIQLMFPAMKIRKTDDRMVMVRGVGLGGTTTLSAGNALRMDAGLKAIGIDLDLEFEELYRAVPITRDHRYKWKESTNRLFAICDQMGLSPEQIPKMGDYRNCVSCGRCVLGCSYGAKWDSRAFLKEAWDGGANIVTGCKATQIVIEQGQAKGIKTSKGYYPADVVVLAAGGSVTPLLLRDSGIECEDRLFVDPVLCVAAQCGGSLQNREISMPFGVQLKHSLISPYFDYLSFFFNRSWRFPAGDILTLMVKLADSSSGSVDRKGAVKTLNSEDKWRLQQGVDICREIFDRFGIRSDRIFLGTLNAGHPGGMLPLTAKDAESFHNDRLPENLYVADASLLPASLGNPPILTIIAMAMRIGRVIFKKFQA